MVRGGGAGKIKKNPTKTAVEKVLAMLKVGA